MLLLCDTASYMNIAHNPVFHKCSKDTAIQYHFIREKMESGEMKLHFVRTKAMQANQLTKSVDLQVYAIRVTQSPM